MIAHDFYARQAVNRRQTVLVIALFVGLVLAVGAGVDVFVLGAGASSPWPVATLAALAVATAANLAAYFRGARLVMASLWAQPLRLEDAAHRQLDNVVTEMALAAGVPRPQVVVIPDPAPNALAAGRDPAHAVLGVTQGLLNLCDRAETQGVVAHEMAHIVNRDTLTMTVVAILFGGAVMLADWGRRVLYFGSERRRAALPVLAVVLLLVALTPLLSRLLAMAVSRQREYLADATAAQLTRNPLGLASALEKIGATTSPLRAATRGTAHLFISNPLRRRLDDRTGPLADLLSTHPPLSRRITLLRAMAHTR